MAESLTSLTRARWQEVLFSAAPRRADLLGLEPQWPLAQCRVQVYRNHAIENVVSVAAPYAAWGSLRLEWDLGDYDDSLSRPVHSDAQVLLLWLDARRYLGTLGEEGLAQWLTERAAVMRAQSSATILACVLDLPAETLAERLIAIPGVHVCPVNEVIVDLPGRGADLAREALFGTPLSASAQLRLARELACRWIPAVSMPPLKAVVVDLDGTLYSGALGEDGATGVALTEGHRRLQQGLVGLRDQGVFIAACSRNEESDVRQLLDKRSDFPLRWEHLSAAAIGWGSKADGIRWIAERLRIAPDAMLFVDDNPGELASIENGLARIGLVHAKPDAAATWQAIQHFPGLWRFAQGEADQVRVRDLEVNAERDLLFTQSYSIEEYFRSLGVKLTYHLHPRKHLSRLAELCRKTNQFNLALRRLNESALADYLAHENGDVVAISLSDRLSSSGIIGVVALRRAQASLHVDELCISCRALGRHIEDMMVAGSLRRSRVWAGCEDVVFEIGEGPRNQPARQWLARFAGREGELSAGRVAVAARRVSEVVPPPGIVCEDEV